MAKSSGSRLEYRYGQLNLDLSSKLLIFKRKKPTLQTKVLINKVILSGTFSTFCTP